MQRPKREELVQGGILSTSHYKLDRNKTERWYLMQSLTRRLKHQPRSLFLIIRAITHSMALCRNIRIIGLCDSLSAWNVETVLIRRERTNVTPMESSISISPRPNLLPDLLCSALCPRTPRPPSRAQPADETRRNRRGEPDSDREEDRFVDGVRKHEHRPYALVPALTSVSRRAVHLLPSGFYGFWWKEPGDKLLYGRGDASGVFSAQDVDPGECHGEVCYGEQSVYTECIPAVCFNEVF